METNDGNGNRKNNDEKGKNNRVINQKILGHVRKPVSNSRPNANNKGNRFSKNPGETEKPVSQLSEVVQVVKETKSKPVLKHINVPDTNVLINDYRAIRNFIKGGNMVVVPVTVIKELDKLKRIDRTKREAMKALREIDKLQTEGNPFLVIENGMIYTRLNLDRTNPDHQIIATLNFVLYHSSNPKSKYFGYDDVKMITDDYTVKILSREVKQKTNLIVEPFFSNKVKIDDKDLSIPIYYVSEQDVIKMNEDFVFLVKGNLKNVPEGGSMIGYSNKKFKDIGEFCAIRQDDKFTILDKNITAFGVSRFDLKTDHVVKTNWGQIIALHYLLNPKISCVFMHGATGSGKTLLALAAGMELKRSGFYPKIVIYRIPESAYGDSSPALPGDVGQKIAPWTEPILQALQRLLKINKMDTTDRPEENSPLDNNSTPGTRTEKKKRSRENKNDQNGNSTGKGGINSKMPPPQTQSALKVFVDTLFEQHKIEIKVLDYVRGITLDDAFIIVDDSQNLNKKNIKDVITRAGKNSKIVFTGDLNQIDSKYIDKESSGLSHAIIKLRDLAFIGIVSLPITVRSILAAAADKFL